MHDRVRTIRCAHRVSRRGRRVRRRVRKAQPHTTARQRLKERREGAAVVVGSASQRMLHSPFGRVDWRAVVGRMKNLVIAIDGPSGAGKGTISRTLSQALGYRHIDTGAMYRAVGWKALHDHISLDDEAAVAALAQRADVVVEGGVVSI